jgi:hypothetical protein
MTDKGGTKSEQAGGFQTRPTPLHPHEIRTQAGLPGQGLSGDGRMSCSRVHLHRIVIQRVDGAETRMGLPQKP